MEIINTKVLVGVGTVVTAVGASLCCIVPVTVVLLGVGSAALGAQLEPIRPFFLGLTLVLLGIAFYQVYKPNKEDCEPGQRCAVPEGQRRQRIIVWVAAILAVVVAAFPYYMFGIWASSDLWTATSEMTIEAMGEQEKAVFYVTGMT